MPREAKSINKPLYIPQKLKSIVKNYGKNDKRKTIQTFKAIQNTHKRQNVPQNHFLDIPRSYLRKRVRDYPKYVQILLDNGIIERSDDYWFIKKRQCYSYRIMPEALKEFRLDNITELPDDKENFLDESKKRQIRKTLDRLKVDKEAAYDWIELYCQELSIDDFNFNYKINLNYVNLKLPSNTVRMSHQKAIMDAMAEGKVIINTQGQDVIMVDADDFVEQKKLELSQEYKMQVDMLKRGIYHIKRSPKNYRLYHNLCNIKKELLRFVTIDGQELVNVDIANSQMAILANIIENKIEYEPGWTFPKVELSDNDYQFLKLAKEGGLYEFVQEMLNLNSRDEAKSQTFESLFSHYGKLSIELYEFKQQFPAITEYIDQFKRLNNHLNGQKHYSTLPIFLQRAESGLIIEEIWDKIPEGTPFLTIHDSFVCAEKDSQMFQNLIKEKLDCKVAA